MRARQVATKVTNVARSDEGKRAALEKRHIEAAEQIVAALGTMKGAAMKQSNPRHSRAGQGVAWLGGTVRHDGGGVKDFLARW